MTTKICLKTYASQSLPEQMTLTLQERLPERIDAPCVLTCEFQVSCCERYYLLKLKVQGTTAVRCQRCLGTFMHAYHNQTELAVCGNDTIAEQLMGRYECIVAAESQINLEDVLTDELHLFAPDKHSNAVDCDGDMSQWITGSVS